MSNSLISNIVSFLFFTLIQVFLFLNFNIYEYGFAFVYVGFVLFLPLNLSKMILLILAFFSGLSIDIFYNTLGIHAFAMVFLAYIKPTVSKLFIPKMMDDINDLTSIDKLGIERTLVVMFILIFIHHLLIFYTINGVSNFFFQNLFRAFLSSIISTALIFTFKKMFFKNL